MTMPARKATKKKQKPKGAPTKYKAEYPEQAYKLCLLGHTDEELATYFEVNVDTINEWKKVHPDFSVSIKSGKAIADGNVADRLYQKAMGFEHDSEEIKVMYNKETNEQYIERVPIRKIYPPDTTAGIFWLKNRQKKYWRDKIEHGMTDGEGNDVPPVTVFQIPDNGRSKSDQTATGLPDESPEQSG